MKALIIYDSVFGNTERIAKAMGESIGNHGNAEVIKVNDAKYGQLQGINLLIVGSPTRGFKPTKAIAEFLAKIPANGLNGINVAAFDTRVNTTDINSKVLNCFVKIFGYAARPIADKLAKKGGKLISQPEGFYVKGSEGPLKDGEMERAAEWAREILKG